MSIEKRQEFESWYRKQQAKQFNFKEELISYCESDVDILKNGALRFQDIFKAETGIDPYAVSITIASACNYVFRKLFLKPHTIGLMPPGGYRNQVRLSYLVRNAFSNVIVFR